MALKYDHFGVPIQHKREGMIHFPEYKVWCSDYEKDPFRIEWIYFEEGSVLPRVVQTVPHVCFLVDNIQGAVKGKTVIYEPTEYQGYWMSFIEEDGVPIEFIQPPK